jgi:pyruvate/2-oxoglutarate dehydrogenase complex dihydrolipoamide acyltransferase (E2) component
MFVFKLPEIGEGVIEGEVVKWLVSQGETIAADQPICEVMTDKATVEISSPTGGLVQKLHAEEGDIIQVHSPLIDIDEDGTGASADSVSQDSVSQDSVSQDNGAAPEEKKAAPKLKEAKKADAKAAPAPAALAPAAVSPAPTAAAPAPRSGGKTLATPAVRRHARESGVNIEMVAGSGKGGRVTRSDVDAVARGGSTPAPARSLPTVAAVPSGTEERIKIIGLRRKIAEQMVRSTTTMPHFTYVEEVDCKRLVDLRAQLKSTAAAHGIKLTYIPMVMKALALVFRQFPQVNATVEEDPLTTIVKGDVNIGVATDTPEGLFVPVVKNVEQKSVLQIAAELDDLVTRTRAGKAALHELQGGTFTITSVGNIGGVLATPIINYPEVAILGFNKIRERAVVVDGDLEIRPMVYLSPSFDHRIIDGAVAARFVAALKEVLENPAQILVNS